MVLNHAAAMPRERQGAARFAGALFLIAMAASLFGGAVVSAALPTPGNPGAINPGGLLSGALIELVNAFAVVGIGACLFPALRWHGERAALGYLCFRVIEAVFCALAALAPLMLIALGRMPWALEDGNLRALYALVASMRDGLANILIPLSFCAGAALFYGLMYKSRLVPRFIPIWGEVGVAAILTMNLLSAFGTTFAQETMMALALPMILNEVFLGFWLLIRGFRPGSTAP